MTVEDEYISLFKARVLHKNTVDGMELTIYDNGIHHVLIPSMKRVDMGSINQIKDLMSDIGGKYYNIFEFDSFSDVDPEVREWAASDTENLHTHTDAMVIRSLGQKIIADFYLQFNRPAKPTRIFYSLEKALQWTFKQMQENRED